MRTSIRLRCPRCNARLKAPPELRGQTRNCPGCDRPLVIKVKPPADSDPVLLAMDALHQEVGRRR